MHDTPDIVGSMEATLRQFFAEEIRAAAALPDGPDTDRVLAAFAAVPREDHAGPGPWLLRSPNFDLAPRRTPDRDPAHLYHNVLIALDEARDINIGQPSLWARLLWHAAIAEGAHILQVGAGSGYFTAILAELAGPAGHVTATEIDPQLAEMASAALAARSNVTLREVNGATELAETDGPFDLIVAFAGVTHPAQCWLHVLGSGGRMLLPVTGKNWWGAMVLFSRIQGAVRGITLGPCGFFPCEGARDPQVAKDLAALWSDETHLQGAELELRLDGAHAKYRITDTASRQLK